MRSIIADSILEKLHPWQREPAQQLFSLLQAGQNCVDLSDCGVGKTFTACAVAAASQWPTLVVCPKIAQTQWKQAAAHFDDTLSVIGYELLREGYSPYGTWEHMPSGDQAERWVCQVCQLKVDLEKPFPCPHHPAGFHCLVRKQNKWNYGKFIFNPAVKFLIVDESQRMGGFNSLNAAMLIAAKRQGLKVLGLSATLASTPLQLRAIGYTLDLFPHPSYFSQWARKYKVRYDASFHGYHWFAGEEEQNAIMAKLRNDIIPSRGVRVSTAEIPGFPEVDIAAELYDLDEADQIARIQRDMVASLAALEERTALDVETPLTIQLRAHQRVELLKVPLAVELAQDYMAKGISVGIFVNFRQTMIELQRLLKCDCIIDGSADGTRYRQRSIDSFQSNKSKIILVNTAAGGVALSLPDKDGNHPRGGLVFPGYSAEKIKQVFGRFPRVDSKSKVFYRVLLAAKTGDVAIHKALRAKMNNLDALNDADLLPNNLTINPA